MLLTKPPRDKYLEKLREFVLLSPHRSSKRRATRISIKLLESLEDAKDSLESNDVQKAQQAIEEGIVNVKERQKLILLADQSKYGWNTVKEYVCMYVCMFLPLPSCGDLHMITHQHCGDG